MVLNPEVYLEAAEAMALCGGSMSSEYALERTLVYPKDIEPYLKEYRKYFKNNVLDQEREHGAIALLLMSEIVK